MTMADENEALLKSFIEAFQVKRGTKEFYLSASEKIRDKDLKKLFLLLSEDEQKHMNFIQYLYQSIQSENPIKAFQEFSEAGSFEDAGRIPEELLSTAPEHFEVSSDADALSKAVKIEAMVFNTYQKLSQNVSDNNTKVIFSDIADQGRIHIEQLKTQRLFNHNRAEEET
jgi:rubrerythrin